MALTTSELWRIRYEAGTALETIGAMPYIDFLAVFDQVVLPYLQEGADTTTSTAVTSAVPAPVTLTLADATGVSAHDRVWVDVDDSLEISTVRVVSGSTINLILTKPHSGTYPVTVDGGVARVRNILRKLDKIDLAMLDATDRAGIKKVDEIEFFENKRSGGSTVFSDLYAQRDKWRRELVQALGLPYYRDFTGSGGGSHNVEVY